MSSFCSFEVSGESSQTVLPSETVTPTKSPGITEEGLFHPLILVGILSILIVITVIVIAVVFCYKLRKDRKLNGDVTFQTNERNTPLIDTKERRRASYIT